MTRKDMGREFPLKIMQPGQAGQFPLSMKTGNMYFINNITDIS